MTSILFPRTAKNLVIIYLVFLAQACANNEMPSPTQTRLSKSQSHPSHRHRALSQILATVKRRYKFTAGQQSQPKAGSQASNSRKAIMASKTRRVRSVEDDWLTKSVNAAQPLTTLVGRQVIRRQKEPFGKGCSFWATKTCSRNEFVH